MSTLTPFVTKHPTKPLKFLAGLRGTKVDSVPAEGVYVGLEQIESWTGRLSGIELQQQPEGSANVFEPGDVLFGKLRPYLAKGWVAESHGFSTTECLVLRTEGVDARFLRYCLLSTENISAIDGSTYGSKMPRADWSFIGSVNFPAPARSDQVRIANFLDEKTARIDALIAEKEQLLVSLDDALEAYAFDFASEGLQRKGTSSGRKEGWLARVPAHWSTPKLGYFADVGNGCTPKREVQKYWLDGTMPWVTSTAINDRVIKETAECVTDCALSETGLRVVRPGSAIVGLIGQGPTRGMTARLAIPATVSQNVAYVTSRSPEVSDDYLVVVLTGLYTALRYLSDGSGGAQGAMNCDTLRAFRVPIAPRSEQDAIVQAFIAKKHAIEGLQEHARAHIQRLSEYRSSLISAAVTGLLQVGTVLKGAI